MLCRSQFSCLSLDRHLGGRFPKQAILAVKEIEVTPGFPRNSRKIRETSSESSGECEFQFWWAFNRLHAPSNGARAFPTCPDIFPPAASALSSPHSLLQLPHHCTLAPLSILNFLLPSCIYLFQSFFPLSLCPCCPFDPLESDLWRHPHPLGGAPTAQSTALEPLIRFIEEADSLAHRNLAFPSRLLEFHFHSRV